MLAFPLAMLVLAFVAVIALRMGYVRRPKPPVAVLVRQTVIYALIAAIFAIALVLVGMIQTVPGGARAIDVSLAVPALVGVAQLVALLQWWFDPAR